VEATAREHIDSDGPGFFFTVEPGRASGDSLIEALATARGMDIRQDGAKVDTLALAGGRGAIASLARCLAESWNEAAIAQPEQAESGSPAAIKT
jgi:hypothetical protein